MKRLAFFILIFGTAVALQAQSESRISLNANSIQVDNFHAYSINPSFELALNDHWNLRYELGFGIRGNKKFYMHTPATLPFGGALFVIGIGSGGSFFKHPRHFADDCS